MKLLSAINANILTGLSVKQRVRLEKIFNAIREECHKGGYNITLRFRFKPKQLEELTIVLESLGYHVNHVKTVEKDTHGRSTVVYSVVIKWEYVK